MNGKIALRLTTIALALFMPVLFLIGNSTASAENGRKSLSVVLVGDSYTAGNGAGSYVGERGSYQSSKNWGNYYVSWLKTQGVSATLTNLAHSGSTSGQVVDKQLDKVPRNTDLVMLTIGGNDAQFEEVVKQCFAVGFRDPAGCRGRIEHATSQFPNIIEGTEEILENLQSRLSPSAQIILVGYPLLSLDKTYVLQQCLEIDRQTDHCIRYDRYDAAKAVREAGQELNKQQRAMIESWNVNATVKAHFVDTIQSTFASHEPDPHATIKNPTRWINEFFETEGEENSAGEVSAKPSLDQSNWYHPNLVGHRKIGLDIINQIGIPSSTKSITPTSSNVDIAFVIDTTGSMAGSINQVKQNINDISHQIQQQTGSARFALVSYQDHPSHGGWINDYPFNVRLPFTHDQLALASATQAMQLGDGGDWQESVYSGAMAALDLDWRPGVRKVMIVIGDAPAKNPEPVTGYTWQQVAQRAYEIDPVEVYAIDTGWGDLSTSLQGLVSQSGGQILSGGNISQSIVDSIDHSTNKPFGWIQGPYVIKIGDTLELDARGSYAVEGEIQQIEWDLDGDGEFETPSTSLLLNHKFSQEFSGVIGIKLTDSNGRIGFGSTQLDVTDDGDTIPYEIDNCPLVANLSQIDTDGDGIGDECDSDIGWPTQDKEGVTVLSSTEPPSPEPEPSPTPEPSVKCNTVQSLIMSIFKPKGPCGHPLTQLINIIRQALRP